MSNTLLGRAGYFLGPQYCYVILPSSPGVGPRCLIEEPKLYLSLAFRHKC